MEHITQTSSAEINGEQLADALFESELSTAKTIGDLRSGVKKHVATVGDGEIGERFNELSTSLDYVTQSRHDGVILKDQIGGDPHIEGQHTFASGQAEAVKDLFTPATIVGETRQKTLGVVMEEDEKDIGHPGQDSEARVNVIFNDKPMMATSGFEGEVGQNLLEKGISRPDVPPEYKDGEIMAQKLGPEMSDYLRLGREKRGRHLQELVWKKDTTVTSDQMMDEGQAVGMSPKEIHAAIQERFGQTLTPALVA